jgi:hypothetical protein
VLACPGHDMVKVLPLPVETPWWEVQSRCRTGNRLAARQMNCAGVDKPTGSELRKRVHDNRSWIAVRVVCIFLRDWKEVIYESQDWNPSITHTLPGNVF